MTPAFFASLVIGHVAVDTLSNEYLDWVLGEGRFARYRNARLKTGVPQSLRADKVRGSGDFPGDNECALSVRRSDGVSLLRLVQRDSGDPSVFWRNIIRLTANGDGVQVEHAITRSAPRGVTLDPKASSPSVVQELIAAYSSGGVEPRDLYTAKIICNDGHETEAFFEHVLMDGSRAVPVLVVTPGVRSGRPVVDATVLAKQLRGMATVAELRTRDCSDALTDSFTHAGFDRQYACVDAGVRLYVPKLSRRDVLHRHPLWIRTRLLDLADDEGLRTELLAGLVALRVADARMPSDLVGCVEDFDRHERRRRAEQLLAAPPLDPAASMDSLVSQAENQISALEAELRSANGLIALYESDNSDKSLEAEAARKRIAELEYEAQQERLKAETLEQQLDAKQQRDSGAVSPELRADLVRVLVGEVPPESALRLVVAAWPDRIVVLDSAFKSARRSAGFQSPDVVLDLLTTLPTEYFDALKRGGDTEARKVFGKKEYAATESESVLTNKGAVKRRTFIYKGVPTEMFAHLKIGTKNSVAETVRIHFHWDAADEKIVIGHCGPHLDFK